MINGTLFLVGKQYITDKYVEDTDSCIMCKRLIINAGIEKVVIRVDIENYRVIMVEDWIKDENLPQNITIESLL